MSTRSRRKKPATAHPAVSPGTSPAAASQQAIPMPKWEWRTFPVYFAFSLGGFIGLYMGLVAGATSNNTVSLIVFTVWAILLGFGFSRITSRWMMSHNWGRRATKKR
ncbi:MAG: hypothetical protein AB7J35_03580 [Dehalococcoidia bacterium]